MRIRSFAGRLSAFLGLVFFLFSGCSTELDSNADYKEILVIHSVLDPSQTTHYAKVNKAFLNSGTNALTIAGNYADSTQYGDELRVVLQQLREGKDSAVVAEYPMERFVATGKEPGIFVSGEQPLYRTTGTLLLDDQATYRIVATNTQTGVSASGATNLVGQNLGGPARKGLCIYKISMAYTDNNSCFSETQASKFEPHIKGNSIAFYLAPKAKIYTVKMSFRFAETTDGVRTEKQVDWYVRENFIIEDENAEPNLTLEPDFFVNTLLALIDRSRDNATTEREAGDVFVTVTAGSSSLERYFRINNSFSVISQTRPEYDNISNGTGLVGSRLSKTARGFLTKEAMSYLVGYPQLKFKP